LSAEVSKPGAEGRPIRSIPGRDIRCRHAARLAEISADDQAVRRGENRRYLRPLRAEAWRLEGKIVRAINVAERLPLDAVPPREVHRGNGAGPVELAADDEIGSLHREGIHDSIDAAVEREPVRSIPTRNGIHGQGARR